MLLTLFLAASRPRTAVLRCTLNEQPLVFDATDVLAAIDAAEALNEAKVAGVYAVADTDGTPRFVGISRNVGASLASLRSALPPSDVATVRIQSFESPNRKEMEELKRAWIQRLGYTPEGNNGDSENPWTAALSSAGAALQSAAADGRAAITNVASAAVAVASATHNPSPGRVTTVRLDASSDAPISPVAEAAAAMPPRSPGAANTAPLKFSVEAVDRVLDEVRPYLISDGGNVAVEAVDPATMRVELALQGACGSCPSSTTTMKMGIERVLREKWPDLGEVVETTGALEPAAAQKVLSVETANEALEQIMPAVVALGGSVTIIDAADSKVTLEYAGPDKIKFGLEMALRDSPLIDEVVFV